MRWSKKRPDTPGMWLVSYYTPVRTERGENWELEIIRARPQIPKWVELGHYRNECWFMGPIKPPPKEEA